MIRYVTLAYGEAPGVYRQSLMLLLSLVAHAPEPYELVVATDRPECYVWFGTRVEIEFLDAARLRAWKGPRPFSMRPKLELLRASFSTSGSRSVSTGDSDQGPARPVATVLLDADVLAVKPLDAFAQRVAAGELFMHKKEYVLSESRRAGNRKLWASLRASRSFSFSTGDAMWNSGVLGVPAADRGLLDEAIGLYDRLAEEELRHFATEQLVEGVILGRTGRLHPASDWFAHYWGNKPGYDAEIACRLADAFIEGMSVKDAAAHYRAHPVQLALEVRRTRAEKLAGWFDKRVT